MSAGGALRAVLCTCGGVHGARVLARLAASPRLRLVGIVRSTRVHGRGDGLLSGAVRHLRRSGLRYALYLAGSVAPRLGAAARGLPQLATRDVDSPQARAFLERLAPDLLVSAFFNQRIGIDTAALARRAALNIHPSLLPGLRGVDPVFYALLRGAVPLGVSVHRIAPGLDTGDLVAQRALELPRGASVLGATARLFDAGALLLLESLDALDAARPQPAGGGYDSWPSRAEVAALRAKGVALARLADLRGGG